MEPMRSGDDDDDDDDDDDAEPLIPILMVHDGLSFCMSVYSKPSSSRPYATKLAARCQCCSSQVKRLESYWAANVLTV